MRIFLLLLLSAGQMFGQAGQLIDLALRPNAPTGFVIGVPTAPITASFSFSPNAGQWPLTVQFLDLTQGGPSSWLWNFGDGSTSTSQNPIHVFQSASNFSLSLTATGPGGMNTTNSSISITNPTVYQLLVAPINIDDFNIGDNGKFRAILTAKRYPQTPNLQGQACLFCYDLLGHTNYVDLTNTTYNAMALHGSIGFLTNRLLVACGQGNAGEYSSIMEYDLLTNGFLPTNAVFVSSNAVGTAYPDTWTRNIQMTVMSNGGVGATVLAYGNGLNGLGAYYRRPSDGVWTNMTSFSGIPGGNLPAPGFPARMKTAENPVDNSFWCYYDGDSGNQIFAAKYVTSSNGVPGLYLADTNLIVNNFANPGAFAVYGELPWIEATSDWTNLTGNIVSYPSEAANSYSFYYGNTPIVSIISSNRFSSSLSLATNGVFLINLSTNSFVSRIGRTAIGVTGIKTYTLTFLEGDTNYITHNLFPIMQQDIVNKVPGVTNFVGYQYGVSNFYGASELFYFHAWSHDVAYKDTNQIWQLRLKP